MRQQILAALLVLCAGSVRAQDWPQWRGPNSDNHVVGFNAPTAWPKELKKKWKAAVGVGESSPALVGDKIYVFGRQGGDEVTLCLDAASGKELWRDKYPAAKISGPASGFPGPRSTIAVGGGKVCTLGVHGVVSCLDGNTGKLVWRKETGSRPQFYTSTSPLMADGVCIVYVGSLTAFNLADGKVKWKWAGAGAPYGSPVLMTADGVKQVVTPTAGGNLVGVALADGKLLWQTKVGGGGRDYQSNYGTPLIDGKTVIYCAPAKGSGGSIYAFDIEKKEDGFMATHLWKKSGSPDKYQTPVLRDGLIYGVSAGDRNIFCLDAKSGKQLWRDDKEHGECGCILSAGPVLLALTSDRQLIAFQPSSKAYKQLAHYEVSDSATWAAPIVAGNRIYVKDKGGSLTLWTIE